MQVIDGLPSVGTLIENNPISMAEAMLFRNHLCRIKDMGVVAGFFDRCGSGYFGSGCDDDMDRRLGIDVEKCHDMIVFINDRARNFAVDNLGEESHEGMMVDS